MTPGANTKSTTFRRGSSDDSYAVFSLFEQTLADLSRRLGIGGQTSWADLAALTRMWEERRSLYEYLAGTAAHFWLAEQDGQPIGFARSIVRDGVCQLTELFVLPGTQSGGVGRELLTRAFPVEGARRLSIIASPDIRAQVLYLKAGAYPRCPIYYFHRAPEKVPVDTNLGFKPVTAAPDVLAAIAEIDSAILDHHRDEDHAWLLGDRQGYLYYRDGRPVGYGYVGKRSGPFALLDADDFPAVLAHAETEAAAQGHAHFGMEVPMINRPAVDYLLARGFRVDAFVATLMQDKPFGRFENYVITSPPFFM
jgi:GNAT superfamily N-acetyltransferase